MAITHNNESDGYRSKRQKMSSSNTNPTDNPYLAHMYSNRSPLESLQRHSTTAAEAANLENGPKNPFTIEDLSTQYFSILKTRRDLPVYAQR